MEEVEQDEEDDDEEVGVISATPLRFPWQIMVAPVTTMPSFSAMHVHTMSTTLSFLAPHVHTMADVHIPSFRQFRQLVLMTPVTLHPSSRTVAGAAGLVTQSRATQPSGSRRTASPADTPAGTQP